MDSITQGVLGAAAAQVVLQRWVGPRAWLYGAIGGMAPDLDILIRSSDPLVGLTYHRHFTHSLAFIPIGGPLSALPWLARSRFRPQAKQIVAATTVGYATHAMLDAFTSYGTQLLLPFSNMRVAWNWISIVDLLFTIPLLVAVVLTARRDTTRPVALGLAWCALYMGWGGVQKSRAVGAMEELADSRGHEPTRVDAFPSAFSNVVWRAVYMHEGTIHTGWVRTPWLGAAAMHPGRSVPVATEASLPAAIREDERTLEAFRRFRWFTRGWIAADPEVDGAFGDLRYGLDIGGTTSMWAIALHPGAAAAASFERRTGRIRLDRVFALWIGSDDAD